MKTVSEKSLAVIKAMQQNELTESVIYAKIASFAKGEENKKTLLRLSQEEHAHYEIWKSYTGIAYLLTVIALITPYLIFPGTQFIPALLCMLLVVILIIAGFTYYTSVAQDEPFKSRFLEMAIISISVAVMSFVVGILAKKFLGVDL